MKQPTGPALVGFTVRLVVRTPLFLLTHFMLPYMYTYTYHIYQPFRSGRI